MQGDHESWIGLCDFQVGILAEIHSHVPWILVSCDSFLVPPHTVTALGRPKSALFSLLTFKSLNQQMNYPHHIYSLWPTIAACSWMAGMTGLRILSYFWVVSMGPVAEPGTEWSGPTISHQNPTDLGCVYDLHFGIKKWFGSHKCDLWAGSEEA